MAPATSSPGVSQLVASVVARMRRAIHNGRAEELLLCDKCDKGFHMKCVRPIVVRVPKGSWLCPKCSGGKRVRGFPQKKKTDFFGIDKDSSDFKNKGSSSQGNVLKFRHIYI
ncbi:Zinc finger, PHD-type [Sesbania bispinosa]|nr:Zinc finger, PHD-type [Sesbania bispinosa]